MKDYIERQEILTLFNTELNNTIKTINKESNVISLTAEVAKCYAYIDFMRKLGILTEQQATVTVDNVNRYYNKRIQKL